MAESTSSRIELNLHEAIKLALNSVEMRKNGILHNLFYLIGRPGGGKTMMLSNEVKNMGLGFISYSPALERVEKFGGIPDLYWHKWQESENPEDTNSKSIEKKQLRTIWSVPQMILEINDAASKYPYVVVLLDDWHLCTDDLQQIGFELFTYYSLNGHKVADNVIFILAGNESSAAGAKVQLSAIKNRSTIIYTKSDVQHWIKNFAYMNDIHPLGISFFLNPENDSLFQEEESTNSPFGSPRSWTSVFNNIKLLENSQNMLSSKKKGGVETAPSNFIYSIVQGSVSKQASAKFMAYYDVYSKIDINSIFNGVDIDIPEDAVKRYAYSSAVTHEFYKRFNLEDEENKDSSCKIFGKILDKMEKKYSELSTVMITTVANIPENKDRNASSGIQILEYLIDKDYLPVSTVGKLKKGTKLLRK